MQPYYYVFNAGNNPPSVRHETLKSAQTEAERLATKHAGKSFEILKCIGVSQTSNVSTFWMDGEKGQDEPQYRDLVDGENIAHGDQYLQDGQWVGYKYAGYISNPYRDPKGNSINKHLPHRRPL